MAIEVKLPNLGEGIDTGDVLELLVKEGDTVAKDQGIIELETGKATMQVPSSAGGKVSKIHVHPGQSIPSGTLLMTLESAEAQSKPAAQKQVAPQADTPKQAAEKGQEPKEQRPAQQPQKAAEAKPPKAAAAPSKPAAVPAGEAPPKHEAAPAPPHPKQPKPSAEAKPKAAPALAKEEEPSLPESTHDGGHVAAGPAVRRFAREVGVDLARVTGSGPSGRVTREDVLAVVRQASQTAASSKPSTATARDTWGPIRPEKLSKIRKIIAAKMHESWTTCPRVTNFDDADVTELERLRVSSKDDYAKKGNKLTSLPFVIKAVASALKHHPAINASLDLEQDQIVYKEYVNIGIAVDTERGLVVPSLRGADGLSIPDVARALAQLSENVRDGSFSIADLQGSTFTISNLGAIGGTYSTPIINTPEVAILLVGRSRKMPVVIDDEIAIRLMMPLSISYDHRLVDGATASRFLNDVIDYLEAPSRLLLAP
ncbi:MAG TPA: 2-oxo acid dehydrogenase subunit E2 [Pirellulaceae bacterium]|jgi:pyruvate dehydrogenase E2 component (dihydrolipoamide acetyltransferase)